MKTLPGTIDGKPCTVEFEDDVTDAEVEAFAANPPEVRYMSLPETFYYVFTKDKTYKATPKGTVFDLKPVSDE